MPGPRQRKIFVYVLDDGGRPTKKSTSLGPDFKGRHVFQIFNLYCGGASNMRYVLMGEKEITIVNTISWQNERSVTFINYSKKQPVKSPLCHYSHIPLHTTKIIFLSHLQIRKKGTMVSRKRNHLLIRIIEVKKQL